MLIITSFQYFSGGIIKYFPYKHYLAGKIFWVVGVYVGFFQFEGWSG